MRYGEFHRNVRKAGLTLSGFAELLRMNRVSLSNYSRRDRVPAHLAVIAALVGEMADKGLDFRAAIARAEIPSKKNRGDSAEALLATVRDHEGATGG